jgi:16S rRNA (guanine1516-N2)-methyltransferase
MMTENIVVFAEDPAYREKAAVLAEKLGITVADKDTAENAALVLLPDSDGLSLAGDGKKIKGDFTSMIKRLKNGTVQQELIVRTAKIKGIDRQPTAIDATAGLGGDSILLAAAGFDVQLYEYNPIICELLRDALERAADVPELADTVSRMHLAGTDSISAMNSLKVSPDVIFLDPMFPERHKTALVKKKFQLIHKLEHPCTDEAELLNAAISAHPRKIVIKRPLKGPYLAGIKPSYSLKGKAVRYDCIVLH